jgi:hypothetical protein
MTISGLVVTLALDEAAQAQALRALQRDARLQLGERTGRKLPVVAETGSTTEGEALVEALAATPGVDFVDVVCVDFSEAPGPVGA